MKYGTVMFVAKLQSETLMKNACLQICLDANMHAIVVKDVFVFSE